MVDFEEIAAVLVAWGYDPDRVFAAANTGDEQANKLLRWAEEEAVSVGDLDA